MRRPSPPLARRGLPGPLAASARLYRRLLRLYPAEHRAGYGPLMQQLFEDQLRAAWGNGGHRALAGLWLRGLADTTRNVILEHLDRWSEPMRSGHRPLLAVAIIVLVIPFSFVVLNFLEYGLQVPIPWNLHDQLWPQIRLTAWRYLYDAVIVLSAPLALGLLFARQIKVAWRPQPGEWARVVVHRSDRIGLALMALAVGLILVMGLYLVGENLPCILGQRTAC